ncbi:hypothetical protein CE143_24315 [Photorhabdus luminescens]|uniref:Uncharacterized protein n=2 Tax=Photorhabdus TaxID=29487 RepID=A0A022PEQ8_9GAMM|nr:hypothetical protein BA1DRAFT_02844 [Photorhabdus aegyptia]PQQ43017.1 hypothetical protein C6H65_01050 [Photorhabdus luminescens]QXF35959.1 hypothetical protein B0X70_24275 [Photorhabdus akhurstii]UJD77795.1 hypothetical protein CE143_24315 [Photorhabdus luminescens]
MIHNERSNPFIFNEVCQQFETPHICLRGYKPFAGEIFNKALTGNNHTLVDKIQESTFRFTDKI